VTDHICWEALNGQMRAAISPPPSSPQDLHKTFLCWERRASYERKNGCKKVHVYHLPSPNTVMLHPFMTR